MLQVILKFDQNLSSFLLQNWSRFDQKSIKKLYRIQSWFRNRYFFDFWSIFDQFWTNFGSKLAEVLASDAVLGALPSANWIPKSVWTPLGTIQGAFGKQFGAIFTRIWKFLWLIFQLKLCIYESTSILGLDLQHQDRSVTLPHPVTLRYKTVVSLCQILLLGVGGMA